MTVVAEEEDPLLAEEGLLHVVEVAAEEAVAAEIGEVETVVVEIVVVHHPRVEDSPQCQKMR